MYLLVTREGYYVLSFPGNKYFKPLNLQGVTLYLIAGSPTNKHLVRSNTLWTEASRTAIHESQSLAFNDWSTRILGGSRYVFRAQPSSRFNGRGYSTMQSSPRT